MFSRFLLLAGLTSGLWAATLRFDMGTGQSPVAPGFIRVTADTQFNARQGYGWESTGQAGFDVPRPPE
ncbi:MAG: hypothetical protein HYR60_12100, partial [Acidobacteria bacterium]|nr:hypothetical protein [Acidobacteriota bacterium]